MTHPDTPTVRLHPDADALAHSVAVALVVRLAEVQASGRDPVVALTGGSIAERIYALVPGLDTSADGPSVDWSRVDFWWGDERYVAAGSQDRNDLAAVRDLLEPLGVPTERVHRMPASDHPDHPDLAGAAAAYADELRAHDGGFDLVMLGMGPDGHVASLFPGSDLLEVRDADAVPVADSPKPPSERISLTFAALGRSEEVWFLVNGEAKADAVRRALADTGSVAETPARGVAGGRQTWWLDEEAASRL